MASTQSATFLSRTRSGRVPASAPKPLVTPVATPARTSSSGDPSTSPQSTGNTSNLTVFLRNIRSLDLDLLPDWPGITSQTFTAKDAGRGQKRRVRSVEWTLYQLWDLWDPDETRVKLQPFFPPQDQFQSVTLRAAILRLLEQVKKGGILGRDVVIRKNVLDECRGERFEEILALFSSAVLRKVAIEDHFNTRDHPAVALSIATGTSGESLTQRELDTLMLAYKISLGSTLRQRQVDRAKYKDFSELLDLKQRGISRRREQVRSMAMTSNAISDGAKLDVLRAVRNNMSGSDRWTEILLYGEVNSRRYGLLTAPYDSVWRRVQSGQLTELDDHNGGLLDELDERVKVQRDRLQRWESFRDKMFSKSTAKPTGPSTPPPTRVRALSSGRGAHTGTGGKSSPRKLASQKNPDQPQRDLAHAINEREIGQGHNRVGSSSSLQASRRPRKEESLSTEHLKIVNYEDEPISELSDLEEQVARQVIVSRQQHSRSKSRPECEDFATKSNKARERTLLSGSRGQAKPVNTARPPATETEALESLEQAMARTVISPPQSQLQSPPIPPIRFSIRTPSPTRSPPRRPAPAYQDFGQTPESPVLRSTNTTDRPQTCMNDTPLSPPKKPRHVLSLAERTRLSMARGAHAAKLEVDEPDFDVLPIRRNLPTTPSDSIGYANGLGAVAPQEGYEDLVARTRKSMAGLDAARQKAQLERRKSQRKSRHTPSASMSHRSGSSYFPTLDEGDSTLILMEELMSAPQDDPAAIFKSRPRIKTSPSCTPVRQLEAVE